MERSFRLRLPVAVGALAVASACGGDTTGPGTARFDPDAFGPYLERVERVIAAPEWASYRAIAERADVGPFARTIPATGSRLFLVPLISDEGRGTTFVYDTQTGGYVPRFSRVGAPDNGVRFILYAVDPITGAPDVTAEVGHADLLDLGSDAGPEIAIQFIVVTDGDIFLDYTVTAAGDQAGGAISVNGFVGRSPDRLSLTMDATLEATDASSASDVRFTIDIPQREFDIRAEIASLDFGAVGMGAVDIRVRRLGTTMRFIDRGITGGDDPSFLVDGDPFAVVAGKPGAPVIRGVDGDLDQEELRVLRAILGLGEGLSRMFGELMAPAGRLIDRGG